MLMEVSLLISLVDDADVMNVDGRVDIDFAR